MTRPIDLPWSVPLAMSNWPVTETFSPQVLKPRQLCVFPTNYFFLRSEKSSSFLPLEIKFEFSKWGSCPEMELGVYILDQEEMGEECSLEIRRQAD